MLTALVCVVGAVGWAMWLQARRDARAHEREADEAHTRLRLAESRASAIRADRGMAQAALHAAEAQARVVEVELRSLRMALSLAEADRAALDAQVKALGSDPSGERYDSAAHRMKLYRKPET